MNTLELIKSIEFVYDNALKESFCPRCEAHKSHEEGCELKELIDKLEVGKIDEIP